MPLLPALITVSNEGMHSCKCAFLHARLVYASGCCCFLPCFNLWPHFYTWVLFIFSPYTCQWNNDTHDAMIHIASTDCKKCPSLRSDFHNWLCQQGMALDGECMLANAFMCFLPVCVCSDHRFSSHVHAAGGHSELQMCTIMEKQAPFFWPAKETTFTIHPSDNNLFAGE